MRIAPVLAEEVTGISAYKSQVERSAPVLAERLGVFALDPGAGGVLPDGRFERDTSVGIDGVSRAAEKGLRQTAVGGEVGGRRSVMTGGLACVSANKTPLSGRPCELKEI